MLMHEPLDPRAINQYPSTVLAYIGDAVFELMVRENTIASGKRKMKAIHDATVGIVKAQNQAQVMRQIYPELSEEEKTIARKGRNAKSTPPRNTDVIAYRMSTGFEALLGYLYLKGEQERLLFLVGKILGSCQ